MNTQREFQDCSPSTHKIRPWGSELIWQMYSKTTLILGHQHDTIHNSEHARKPNKRKAHVKLIVVLIVPNLPGKIIISSTSQTMRINSLVVARQNVPITFIHSETTLS